MNKKGISGIIVTVILIALTMAVTIIVWTVVNNLVSEKLKEAKSCFGIFEKVIINNKYTCYDYSSYEVQFSINIGEIDVDEVLVSISGEAGSKSFKISNEEKVIDRLRYYFGTYNSPVKLPGKEGGTTYVFNWTGAFSPGSEKKAPNQIQIAPVINEKQCEVSDSLSEISNCGILS